MVSFIPNSYNVYLYMHSINPIFYRIFYISILLIFFPFLSNGFEPYFIVLVSITSKVKYVCHCSALQQRVETNVFLCKWFGMYYVGKYMSSIQHKKLVTLLGSCKTLHERSIYPSFEEFILSFLYRWNIVPSP